MQLIKVLVEKKLLIQLFKMKDLIIFPKLEIYQDQNN